MPTRREAASLQTEEMASGRQLCSLNTFRWSEDEVTLKELGEFYGRLLPFPILITKYLVTEGEGFYSVREGDVRLISGDLLILILNMLYVSFG